ncbi:MAG: acyltransferase family protein [Solirubrobacterales bacterium]
MSTESIPVAEPLSGGPPLPPEGTSGGGRLEAFPDVAKIAAIVGVVTVHAASAPNDAFGTLTDKTWFVSVLVEVAFRWCVPVFVMVSGMLLLRARTAEMAPGVFYRRRLARVAVPLVGWTVFYRLFTGWTGPDPSFEENVQAVYGGVPYFHLYFLYLIAGLYLVAPYLARAIRDLSQRQLGALSIGALAVGFLWGGVPPWLPATSSNAFSLFAPFVGYFLAGCWLSRVRLDRQLVRGSVAVFVLVGIASALATYEFAHSGTRLDWHYLYGYTTPSVIVMSLCVFVAIRYLCERREARRPIRHTQALHYVGEATFGIFLIHPALFMLWIQSSEGIPSEAPELIWWLPLTVAGLIAISFACTLAMKRIPYLRRLV